MSTESKNGLAPYLRDDPVSTKVDAAYSGIRHSADYAAFGIADTRILHC